MKVIKDIIIAFNFISALVGAGLASGKEIVVFMGNANYFSVALCGIMIGCFAFPFILLGIRSEGNTLSVLFKDNQWVGNIIIRIMNFIFLGAMLGGAESLLYEISGIKYGGFIIAIITLICCELGENFTRLLNAFSVPLILIALLVLFHYKHPPINGEISIYKPLLYACMNTSCAGIYASKFCSGLKNKDAFIICSIIAVVLSTLFIIARRLTVGVEDYEIPIYSVSIDTNFRLFGALIILISILTSCISSLKLCSHNSNMSSYSTCFFALIFSFVGFSNIIKYVYPTLGFIGISLLFLTVYRASSPRLKNCKKWNLYL